MGRDKPQTGVHGRPLVSTLGERAALREGEEPRAEAVIPPPLLRGDPAAAARPRGRPGVALPALRRSIPQWMAEERAFGHLFLLLPVAMGLGALLWFQMPRPPHFAFLAVLTCIFAVAACRVRHAGGLGPCVIALASAGLFGMMAAAVETGRADTILLDSAVTTTVTGRVMSREVAGEERFRYTVRIDHTSAPHLRRPPRLISLLVRGVAEPVEVGRRVRGRLRLAPPSGPALPGLNDFAFDAYFRGQGAVGYAYGRLEVLPDETQSVGLPDRAFTALSQIRESVGARIRTTIGGDAGAVAAALVTGEERAISEETVEALRLSGLGHVLAISGMNMVLAAGTLLIGLRFLLATLPGLAHRVAIKKIAASGALLLVTLYLLMSGGAVSAVRSYVMIGLMLIAVFLDRPSITLRNIALAALLILAVQPSAVAGPGFQMSFSATLALVALYARWREIQARRERSTVLPAWAQTGLTAFSGLVPSAVIGGLSTLIYAAAHFNRLPAYGLLGNLLVMPLIGTVIMPSALLTMLLMPLGLDSPALFLFGWSVEAMLAAARFVAGLGGQIITGQIPAMAFLLIALGGCLACVFRTPLAVSGLLFIAIGLVIAALTPLPAPAVIIAEDGRLVALDARGATASNRARPPAFIYDQWQRALRLPPHRAPKEREDLTLPDFLLPPRPHPGGRLPPLGDKDGIKQKRDALAGAAEEGVFTCVPRQWCAARLRSGDLLMTVEDVRLVGFACDVATIVVTGSSPRFPECRSGALLFTAASLRRSGAVMLFPDPGAARGYRMDASFGPLNRPWQRHRTYDWRQDRFEPDEESDAAPQ